MTEIAPFPQPAKQLNFTVIIAGLVTTAVTLLIVYALCRVDFNVMGIYLGFVIPAGALCVGLAAGSGYVLASWRIGIKVTAPMFVVIVVLQLASYGAAEYINYRDISPTYDDGSRVDFLTWFDFATRSFAWKDKSGKMGEPMGAWGYGIRLLEVAGFAFGGVFGALILMKKAYCEPCQVYMSQKQLALLVAAVKKRKFGKKDAEAASAHQAEQEQVFGQAQQYVEHMAELASQNQVAEFRQALADLAPTRKEAAKIWRRLTLALVRCKRCHAGYLLASVLEQTGNNKFSTKELARWDVPKEFVQQLAQE